MSATEFKIQTIEKKAVDTQWGQKDMWILTTENGQNATSIIGKWNSTWGSGMVVRAVVQKGKNGAILKCPEDLKQQYAPTGQVRSDIKPYVQTPPDNSEVLKRLKSIEEAVSDIALNVRELRRIPSNDSGEAQVVKEVFGGSTSVVGRKPDNKDMPWDKDAPLVDDADIPF